MNDTHRFCLVPSPVTILCHQQTFGTAIYWDQYPRAAKDREAIQAKAVLEYDGRSDEVEGHARQALRAAN
jgi:hypothetical protein